MKTEDKKTTVDTLKERPLKVKVGRVSFIIKPLTFMQIYEMSVFANDIKAPTWGTDGVVNIMREIVAHGNDARLMCEIFIVCAFRKTKWRWFWGRYIRKHLDVLAFNELVKFISRSFNANFFLTSITFLTQTKMMTEPSMTHHGRQSGE